MDLEQARPLVQNRRTPSPTRSRRGRSPRHSRSRSSRPSVSVRSPSHTRRSSRRRSLRLTRSRAWYSPVTWEATNWESVKIFTFMAPRSWEIRRPAKKTSFSAVLLVIGKDKPREISMMIPSLFLRLSPALLPLELEDPSTKRSILPCFPPRGRSFRLRSLRTPAPLVPFWIRSVYRIQIIRVTTSSSFQRRQGDPRFVWWVGRSELQLYEPKSTASIFVLL